MGGCDAASDPAPGGPPLEGREFLLDSAQGFSPVAETTVRLHFDRDEEGSRFGFYADCNHHSGVYEIRDGRLLVLGFGSTEIGCDEPRSTQDRFLSDFFVAGPELALDGDTLTFTGESATLVFLDREVADPDRPLTGRLWTVDTFLTADAASNRPLAAAPTVRFDDDGTLEVFSGCNTGTGAFTQTPGGVRIEGIAYTGEGCSDVAAADAAAHVQAVLSDGEVRAEIEANRLTLMHGELGLGATTD